jgi:hypothetical protein
VFIWQRATQPYNEQPAQGVLLLQEHA